MSTHRRRSTARSWSSARGRQQTILLVARQAPVALVAEVEVAHALARTLVHRIAPRLDGEVDDGAQLFVLAPDGAGA